MSLPTLDILLSFRIIPASLGRFFEKATFVRLYALADAGVLGCAGFALVKDTRRKCVLVKNFLLLGGLGISPGL